MNGRGLTCGVGGLFWQVPLTDSSTLNPNSLGINLPIRVCGEAIKEVTAAQ